MADKPVTREEKYLAYLTGDYKGELPKPITRKEKYLYELCLKGIGGEISPEEIKNAVNEYLKKNPVKPGATTEQAQQIEQNKTDIGSLKTETGSLKEDLANIQNEVIAVVNSDDIVLTVAYEKGWINSSGENLENDNAYRSKDFIAVKDGMKISNTSDIEAYVLYYNADKTLELYKSIINTPRFESGYAYIKIVVKKVGIEYNDTKKIVLVQGNTLAEAFKDTNDKVKRLNDHFVERKSAQFLNSNEFLYGKKLNNTAFAQIDDVVDGLETQAVTNIIDVEGGETYKTNIASLGKSISLSVYGYTLEDGAYKRSEVYILTDSNGITSFTVGTNIKKIRITILSSYDKFTDVILAREIEYSDDMSKKYYNYTEMLEKVDYNNLFNVPESPSPSPSPSESTDLAPKLTMRNCMLTDGTPFQAVNMSYTTVYNICGAIYGITKVKQSAQSIYKSADGGMTWTKVGDVSVIDNQLFTEIYVENRSKTIVLLRDNDTTLTQHNFTICTYDEPTMSKIGTFDIGTRDWLSSTHNIDSGVLKGTYTNVIIFGEYAHSYCEPVESVRAWKTTDRGATWTQIKSFTANNGTGGSGEIRHIHGLRIDPFTNDWWLCSGDSDSQCRVFRSQDSGDTWELIVSGSQHERTTSFVFEQDYVYFGMDSPDYFLDSDIYKINKNTLEKTKVCSVYGNYAIYNLTRTLYPKGILIWTVKETASLNDDYMYIQFYSYDSNSLLDVAKIRIANYGSFTGFNAASNYQDIRTGSIIARATDAFKNDYNGNSVNRSNYYICDLSM